MSENNRDIAASGDDRFRKYAYLVEQAEDGLCMLDEAGTFTVINEAFVGLTGYDREEVLGSDPSLLLSPDDYENVNREIRAARRLGHNSGSVLTTFQTKPGTRKPVELRFSLLPAAADGSYTGLTAVARDVRERRHREQKLDVLSRVLRHNVRNKINLILGHADIIADADDEHYRRAATKIEQAADDLMAWSEKARTAQTEVGFNPSERQRTNLAALLEHLAVQFRRSYPDAKITTALPEELSADTSKSYRIAVSEFVENGIEHNPDDNPAVRIRLVVVDDEIRTIVEDECPPIPDTERRAINQGEETPLVHSLGMGLWLANWVADTLGGELRFERRENDEGNRAILVLYR